jgi:hypothetical protein
MRTASSSAVFGYLWGATCYDVLSVAIPGCLNLPMLVELSGYLHTYPQR